MKVIDFAERYLDEAAELFSLRYRLERDVTGLLPARHADPSAARDLIGRLAGRGPAVAAVDEGPDGTRLIGFLTAIPAQDNKIMARGVLSPEFGHAAGGSNRGRVYRGMYRELAARWVEDGRLTHTLAVLAHDEEAARALFWSGFGLQCVDAVRPLEPLNGLTGSAGGGIAIDEAGPGDIAALMPLIREHEDYYRVAPIFFPAVEPGEAQAALESWVSAPANHLWVARRAGEPVGMMRSGPANDGASYIVFDQGTASISGAYIRPGERDRGVGTALLARVIDQASREGYERLGVDFEATNVYGSPFWLKHFAPVSYSLLRRVDPRVAPTR